MRRTDNIPVRSQLLSWALTCLLSAGLVTPTDARAEVGEAKATEIVPSGDLKAPPEHAGGWDYTLSLSSNFSIAQNSHVVGQVEGLSYIFGVGVVGTADYLRGPSEWHNTLTLIESFSRTPALDRLAKTNDVARLNSLYAYYFLAWLGGFGKADFEAPMLKTLDYSSTPTTYIDDVGSRMDRTEVLLALPFRPLTMTQSLGLTARPLERDPATITLRLGAGGRETFTGGALVRADIKDTPEIELARTDDIFQGGVEAAVGLVGKLPEQRLTYGIDFGYFVPVLNNDPMNRGAFDLARLGLTAAATFDMWEWLGLTYAFRLIDDPQLVDDLQVQNNVLLTFKYDVIPPKKAQPAPDAAAEALKASEARAAAAEERAQAAEERARAAEERARTLESAPPPAPTPPTTP